MKSQEEKNSGLKKINIQGDIYLTNYTKKYEKRKPWVKPDEKQIISFIPGTIRQILIKEGDIVDADQKIMVLEAMKMMNSINSPIKGKIKSVKVNVGDCIPKGTLLIEFE